jgi:hypothetical protein
MATLGESAGGVTITVVGATPSTLGQEVDLAIDAAGDLLNIDSAGDHLIVTPGVTWTGKSASETV